MSEYPGNEKNNTFTWLSSLYNPFKVRILTEYKLNPIVFSLYILYLYFHCYYVQSSPFDACDPHMPAHTPLV